MCNCVNYLLLFVFFLCLLSFLSSSVSGIGLRDLHLLPLYMILFVIHFVFCVSLNMQLGANGYAFVINHNGFVVFHPGLRLMQV